MVLSHAAQTQHSVTLAWDPDSGSTVAGYNVYYGSASRTYTNWVTVGNTPEGTVPGLNMGTTYYFTVTAVDASGLESDYSNEVAYTVPLASAKLQLRLSPTRQAILDATGPAGQSYDILAATKFGAWTNLGAMTLGANGTAEFIDATAAGQLCRFYRLRGK
jgi:hypothetical protein